MKVRTIKKLIAQYPPIIEIRLPEKYMRPEIMDQLKWIKENSIPKYLRDSLVIVFPLEDEPQGIFCIDPSISKKKLEKFKEDWIKHSNDVGSLLLVNEGSKMEWVEIKPPSYVTIHSAIIDHPMFYEKTKEKFENKIKEINM